MNKQQLVQLAVMQVGGVVKFGFHEEDGGYVIQFETQAQVDQFVEAVNEESEGNETVTKNGDFSVLVTLR